jgi:hypothetical protein
VPEGDILGSAKFGELIDSLKPDYDYIIIDTPPLNVVTDALLIGPKTDGIILVVRDEFTPHDTIKRAIDSAEFANIKILGAVGGHFRRISTARTLLDNGRSGSDLQKLCGIPDFAARKTMEAARRFKPEFCAKAASLILETDYQMKTSFDDNERLLELLILQLSQEALHG